MKKNAGQKRKSRAGIAIGIMLTIAAALTAGWFLTADYRAYMEGIEHFESGRYTEAEAIFEELSDYRDSEEKLTETRYCIADNLMGRRLYLEAAESFAALDNYSDSLDKMEECYYRQAKKERGKEEYDSAYEHFVLAGDYEDAAYQAQNTIYKKGHDAFMEENYEIAFECFESLEGGEEEYGECHFMTLNDADEYLENMLDDMESWSDFYIAEKLDGESLDETDDGTNVYYDLINYIPYYIGSATYYEDEKMVSVYAMSYYTGDIILDAWEKGDTSELNEDESAVLELALELIDQAKAETDSDLELEMWLHDWLCKKITYENPDMNVSAYEFLDLRQLSCIGAMLDGKANCQGYTDAFYLLGNLAGFEVGRVFGDTDEGHVWNTILLNGKQYIVDVTFDDIDEEYGGWTYTYFNAPWDPGVYKIYGGVKTVPDIARDFECSISRFSLDNSCFDDPESAARHVVKKLRSSGKNWVHAVIEDTDITWDEFNDELDSVRGSFGDGRTWVIYVDYYNGNSYVSVKFI